MSSKVTSELLFERLKNLVDDLVTFSKFGNGNSQNDVIELLLEIKKNWQIILGINEENILDSKLEDFAINISSQLGDYTFHCLRDRSLFSSHIGQVGITGVSLDNGLDETQMLDREIPEHISAIFGNSSSCNDLLRAIDNKRGETSTVLNYSTEKTSVINKIRKVLIFQSLIIGNLSSTNDVLQLIMKCYQYELRYNNSMSKILDDSQIKIQNSSSEKNPIDHSKPLNFICDDTEFQHCYDGFLMLLLSKLTDRNNFSSETEYEECIEKKILKAAKVMIGTYLKVKDIKLMYDLDIILSLEREIIDIIVYLPKLSSKEYLIHLIQVFFSKDPILPIINILLSSETDEGNLTQIMIKQEPVDDTKELMDNKIFKVDDSEYIQNKEDELPIDSISEYYEDSINSTELINLLKDIINEYSRLLKKSNKLNRLSSSEKWFPNIFKTYVKILSGNSDDLDEDLYYRLVKNSASLYTKENVTIKNYESGLQKIILIMFSESVIHNGVLLPTLDMRYAIVEYKNNVKLKVKYLKKWYDLSIDSELNLKLLASFEKEFYLKLYLKKWINKYQNYKKMEVKALLINNSLTQSDYFYLWNSRYKETLEMQKRPDAKYIKNFFSKFADLSITHCTTYEDRLKKFKKSSILQRSFNIWKLNYRLSTINYENTNSKLKQKILHRWESEFSSNIDRYEYSISVYLDNLKRSVFNKWKVKSKDSIDKTLLLKSMQNFLIVSNKFKIWYNFYIFKQIENKLILKSSLGLKKRVFNSWKKYHKYEEMSSEFLNTVEYNLIKKRFKLWYDSQKLTEKADSIRNSLLAAKYIKAWRLRLQILKFQETRQFILLDSTLRRWLENSKVSKIERRFGLELAKRKLVVWKARAQDYVNLQTRSDSFYRDSQSKIFFRYWQKRKKQVDNQKRKASLFFLSKEEERSRNFCVSCFLEWENKTFNVLEHKLELENRYYSHYIIKFTISKRFNQWKHRNSVYKDLKNKSEIFREISLVTPCLNKWIFNLSVIRDELNTKMHVFIENKNVRLLKQAFSQFTLKMIKLEANNIAVISFEERTARIRLNVFFNMWKFTVERKKKQDNANLLHAKEISNEETLLRKEKQQNLYKTIPNNESPLSYRVNMLSQRRSNSNTSPSRENFSHSLSNLNKQNISTERLFPSEIPKLGPDDVLMTPLAQNNSTIFKTNSISSTLSVPATERIRRMQIQQRKENYRRVKENSPEKIQNPVITPTRPSAKPTVGEGGLMAFSHSDNHTASSTLSQNLKKKSDRLSNLDPFTDDNKIENEGSRETSLSF
ncbi:hypothetical protein BVG19_g1471 [[Candida] boidinii]|nr:hypothetical protein BVG19_g1471 [[Candida] boidinii]OWB51048.1 hypothetical protein B5S27_g2605 [[Candida] boidinii]